MFVSFNQPVSYNRQQRQNFGGYASAVATRDSLGVDLKAGITTLEDTITKINDAMEKEDSTGKKLLELFKNNLTGNKNQTVNS